MTMAYLAARLAVVPIGALTDAASALASPVLSIGSGYGLLERYLAAVHGFTVEGYDLDSRRIAAAARTSARAPNVTVRLADVTNLDADGVYGGALAIDVLHHIAPDDQLPLLASLQQRLQKGAICLIKDIARTPRWKFRWNQVHDRVVSGPEEIHCREPAEMAALASEGGFEVTRVRRLAPLSPYPHYLVVARTPLDEERGG
jgi:2-polyprenyl-3-methyl-5-hydroxy-6-metoxy-1,4-benzoquinol methylase